MNVPKLNWGSFHLDSFKVNKTKEIQKIIIGDLPQNNFTDSTLKNK